MFLSISLVLAGVPNFQSTEVVPSNGHANVKIPENAVEVAPGIFSLGVHVDPTTGQDVEGYAIFKYKKENAKPSGNGKGGSSCYVFLSNGAKWKTQEDYLVDPTNNVGLDEIFVRDNLAEDIQEWENSSGKNSFGNEVYGNVNATSIGSSLNGQNEVVFGGIDNPGAIAVTIVWGRFEGPIQNRELVEWDMVYDQVDFAWSSSGSQNAMDFENIAQHELGHAFGLGHPSISCTEETMYAYASLGETKKRDLGTGDIAGIKKLYN